MKDLQVTDPFDLAPMDDMFRGVMRPWMSRLQDQAPRIQVDLAENDGRYVVKADIPGVRKEDIDVRVDGNQVTITAEVKKEDEDRKDGRLLRSERQFGFASRSFALASDVDEAKAAAKYKDGVLELTLPKKAPSTSRRLQIG